MNDYGYLSVIVTNQRGVALGRMSLETVNAIHDQLRQKIAEQGLNLTAIYLCPHDHGVCTCRKPEPGMLLQAAQDWQIDLANSWMIGDAPRDIEAGRRAGCHTVLVGVNEEKIAADFSVATMSDLPKFLRTHLRATARVAP